MWREQLEFLSLGGLGFRDHLDVMRLALTIVMKVLRSSMEVWRRSWKGYILDSRHRENVK
jgi:hypothetical protein